MKNDLKYKTILGAFILIGLLLLITSIYVIGSKKNMFSSTINLLVYFHEVSGLQGGNNVRFRGIDVGTIKSVTIENDSTVKVLMIIEKKSGEHIKKNAVASIGTDGLMGNKIINIHNLNLQSTEIEEGDILEGREPIAMEEVYITLNNTNENIKIVTDDLKTITKRISTGNNIWNLLSDTVISINLKKTVANIKDASSRTASISDNVNKMVNDIKTGKISLGSMLMDSSLRENLNLSLSNIILLSDSVAMVTADFKQITQKLKNGEGALGIILKDTVFMSNLSKSMENVKNGTDNFNKNMEALKHNFLLRNYFKRQKESR